MHHFVFAALGWAIVLATPLPAADGTQELNIEYQTSLSFEVDENAKGSVIINSKSSVVHHDLDVSGGINCTSMYSEVESRQPSAGMIIKSLTSNTVTWLTEDKYVPVLAGPPISTEISAKNVSRLRKRHAGIGSCGAYHMYTERVGDGDPHQNPLNVQLSGCEVRYQQLTSFTISWSASAEAYSCISAGFAVEQSVETGPVSIAMESPARGAKALTKPEHLVEEYTFASISLKCTEISIFADLFKDARRRALLRYLELDVEFPNSRDHGSREGFAREEFASHKAQLGIAVKSLFNLLSDWKTDYGDLKFSLLLSTEGDHLDFDRCGRLLHPIAIGRLIDQIPLLHSLTLVVKSPANKQRKMRKQHRKALAKSLTLPLLRPDGLRNLLYLKISNNDARTPEYHCYKRGNLQDNNGVDPLNDAIRKLGQQTPLQELTLQDTLHQKSGRNGLAIVGVAFLQRFYILAHIVAPSGEWYFTGDKAACKRKIRRICAVNWGDESPVEDSSTDDDKSDIPSEEGAEPDDHGWHDGEEDRVGPRLLWRDMPDSDTLGPLLVAMARGLGQDMPRLRHGTLYVRCESLSSYDPDYNVEVQCAAAGWPFALDLFQSENGLANPHQAVSSVRTCRISLGRSVHSWVVPDEMKSAWRDWLGDDGVLEIGTGRWKDFVPSMAW
ncbi:hypothetical protein B0H63DRAFT_515115 [Podospora didyma]|uniref:Uncharacterized protein n=1 Tax=Podospora didyma TaxID=330526 RepID=A0AAE0K2T0_9PEZI|nr:hypothetical protein B0H63DRAFT_515115 [Podospora didyma]